MGRLRAAWDTIIKQLSALPLAGKLLFASVGVIIVMALLLVAVQSSKQSMVELLPGAAPEDQVKAKSSLDAFGITYKMENGRLLVARDTQYRALAMLGQEGKLPQNTEYLFGTLLSQNNWMDSQGQQEFKRVQALQNELGRVISNFKGIEEARVMIDAPEPMGLGVAHRRPTASVSIKSKQGKTLDKELVDAIAAMVAGAKAGLAIIDVKVVDANTGRLFTARNPGDFRAGDYMEHVSKVEQHVQGKLQDFLRYIPGVSVAVTAQVDVTKRTSETSKVLPIGQGSVSTVSGETEKERQDTTGGGGGEPGLASNTGADINSGSRGGSSNRSTEKETESKNTVSFGTSKEAIVDPRGMPTKLSVMISLPREYLAMLVKQDKPAPAAAAPTGGAAAKDAEPTQQEIEAKFTTEKERLERDLGSIVTTAAVEAGAQAPDPQASKSVIVSMIPVPMNLVLSNAGTLMSSSTGLVAGSASSGLMAELLSPATIRTVALGGAALLAMGMMLMLVKKNAKPIELPTAQEIVGLPPALETQNDVVGEADEGSAAMDGIELGDDELKYKKMLEQVQDLVKKHPADAAAMLNRWVQPQE